MRFSSGFAKVLGFTLFYSLGASAEVAAPVASDPASLLGARSNGRAGSTAASQLTHDSLLQNPSSAAFAERYAVSAGYQGGGDSLTASIVDTKSGPVGGGVYYLRRDLRGVQDNKALGDLSRIEEHAGFSMMGKVTDTFAFGTNVKYAYRRSFDARLGNAASWNFDAGARVFLSNQFEVGLVGQNLLAQDAAILPRRYVAAVEFLPMPTAAISAQVFKLDPKTLGTTFVLPSPNQTVGWSVGAEYKIEAIGAAIRSGYQANPAWNQKLATFGAGYDSRMISLDYAFQLAVDGSNVKIHSLMLTGYF